MAAESSALREQLLNGGSAYAPTTSHLVSGRWRVVPAMACQRSRTLIRSRADLRDSGGPQFALDPY